MAEFILRVAGVNFGATLYDTNDLAVIRGASLMLLDIGRVTLNVLKQGGFHSARSLSEGASTVEVALDVDETGAKRAATLVREALARPPWAHMSFVIGVADERTAAAARCASAQFRQWTVPPCPAPAATRQDALDGVRGASKQLPAKGWVSDTTYERLEEGRKQRSAFFLKRLGDAALDGVRFCSSFEDQIADWPAWVSEQVARKIAVMHFDGDGFGAASDAVGVARFGAEIEKLSRKLLGRLVGDVLFAEEQDEPDKPRLRLEVLVWGGDDITLVAPAWRALDLMAAFYSETRDWEIGGVRLRFTGGCVIAPFKAPIRQLTRLAGEAVDLGKEAAARGGFSIDIFESAAPPEDGLAAHRARIHGADAHAKALSCPGSHAEALVEAVRAWRRHAGETRPARGKVIGWLVETAGMTRAEADALIEKGLADERARLPGRGAASAEEMRLPRRADADRALALDLRMAMELWDYAATAPTPGLAQ